MPINRSDFLRMCQRISVLTEKYGIKQDVPDELKVTVRGCVYYPVSYELAFDSHGNAVHYGILHDLNMHSTTKTYLQAIFPFDNSKES